MCRKLVSLTFFVLACCNIANMLSEFELLHSKPSRCTYEYVFEMYGAHCAGLQLEEIPEYLKTSIEVLDFSSNHLKDIMPDTLSRFSSLKFLYLSNNQIFDIHEDAFNSLTSLQTLDLSNNVLQQFPVSIFMLPNLEKLYLSGNRMGRYANVEVSIKTIKAPLQLLDLSNGKLRRLPEWGMLPQLLQYNISYNPIETLHAKHFSTMCNLKKIDMTKSIGHIKPCELRQVVDWFDDKKVNYNMHMDDYNRLNSDDFAICRKEDVPEDINATYFKCKEEDLIIINKTVSRRTWLTVGGGLAGFLIGFMLLLYVMHRVNVAQIRKKEQAKRQRPKPTLTEDSQATAILLDELPQAQE